MRPSGPGAVILKALFPGWSREIISGLQQEESFQDTYTRYLQTEFSRNELIWMVKNPEELRGLLEQEPVFSGSGNVIDSLKKELAARVFQNSGIRELIVVPSSRQVNGRENS